jgi:hypothetical protein
MDTSPKGNNATLAVLSIATGSIRTVEVYNFGAGYVSAPTLSAAGGNQDASFTANLSAYGEYAGYYTGTTGLLSGVPKIQDGNYYQDFSYVLKTDFDVNVYRNDVKRITHPSGMIMFGELAIRNKVSARLFDDGQSGNVDSFNPIIGPDARRYHSITLSGNSQLANVQYKSSNTQPELEIFTAKHPWQAMDAKLEVRGDNNLLEENYRDVTIARTTSTTFTVTDTLHGLLAGDTIQIEGFPQGLNEIDYWDGKYVIQTIVNSNTYQITAQGGDPGVGVTVDPYFYVVFDNTALSGTADVGDNILLENGDSFIYEGSIEYLKIETISLANVWLANTSNWDSPFSGSFIMEAATDPSAADDEKILLEPGGSYLYPKLQFPEAETGTVSINMSFNSDVLLEDYTTGDLGMESSGYLLDEQSGLMGAGPARYISLEEDTEGPDYQYESIPIVDTHVTLTLLDSMRQGFLTEDGEGLICEDDIYSPKLMLEDGTYIALEDSSGQLKAETLADVERSNETHRLITERFGITDGSFTPVYHHTEHFSTSILGRMLYEDGDIIFGENTFGGFLTEITSPPIDKEIEFNLLDSIRGGFQTEDSLDYIVGEDNDSGEGVQASKFISEQPPFEKTPVIIHDPLISPSGRLIMEDTEATLLAFEDSSVTIKSYILEEGKFGYVMAIEKFISGEREIDLTAGTGQHIGMEDGYHYLYEDESIPQLEEAYFKYPMGEVEYNLVESTGYHILTEGGVEHLTYEDGTRLVINDIEFQTSLHIPIVSTGALTWNANNHGGDIIANSDSKIVTSTYGLQPFRPHFTSQWASVDIGFVDDNFTMEDDTGVILLEHPFGNRNYLMQEDYPAVLEDIMNPFREIVNSILLEDQSDASIDGTGLDFIEYEEATQTGGTARAVLESSNLSAEGYGVDYTPSQYWTVLPAYQYTKVLERFTGKITFADEGTTGSGADTLFTTELRVGDEFQTANENIIDEDTGGGILFETDERIEHESVTIADIQNVALTSEILGIEIEDFRWFMSNEDSDLTAHGTHPGVIGTYSVWDTALESYWFVTTETNANLKVGFQESGEDIGVIDQNIPEWDNNNMLWEDLSKQLITEPQAFIVGSIANDTSLTVTRKHLGGVSDSIYQM